MTYTLVGLWMTADLHSCKSIDLHSLKSLDDYCSDIQTCRSLDDTLVSIDALLHVKFI